MNEREICEKISEWFEPRPVEPPDINDSDLSPKKAWQYVCIDSYTGEWGWVHSDYFTSEDANARLLEAMQSSGNVNLHGANGWGCEAYRSLENGALVSNGGVQHSSDRKTSVVLAFCKWAGIEVDRPHHGLIT